MIWHFNLFTTKIYKKTHWISLCDLEFDLDLTCEEHPGALVVGELRLEFVGEPPLECGKTEFKGLECGNRTSIIISVVLVELCHEGINSSLAKNSLTSFNSNSKFPCPEYRAKSKEQYILLIAMFNNFLLFLFRDVKWGCFCFLCVTKQIAMTDFTCL